MKKNLEDFNLFRLLKNLIIFSLNKNKPKNSKNYEYLWKFKNDEKILLSYWKKENIEKKLYPLVDLINKNNLKNLLEIGCAAGGVLKYINLNCSDVKNLYGTEFNSSFCNFGIKKCKEENLSKIKLVNIDINANKICSFFKDIDIDIIISNYTLSQLKNQEFKIDEFISSVQNLKPKYILCAEIFDLNNKFKILNKMQNFFRPDRIFVEFNKFNKLRSSYNVKTLKTIYNQFGIKFSLVLFEKN